MRKTLVIGLGGTGFEVVDKLVTRLAWDRRLEDLPYVDYFCVDTDDHGTSESGVLTSSGNAYFHHAQANASDMEELRKKHDDLQRRDRSWMDARVFDVKNVVKEGTSGYRMLGRMMMFLNQNFQTIKTSVHAKIDRLVRLDVPGAQDRVRVVVIATACGGTGSGTFVDMGFLLRDVAGDFTTDVELTGILTLPPADETSKEVKANAYAALRELNHFSSDGQEYTARYPGRPKPISVRTASPYDRQYVVSMVRRPGGMADPGSLNATLAQFLHTDIAHPKVAEVRDARATDRMGGGNVDDLGNTLRFMSLGVSYLEYPGERIRDGCTYRLLTESVRDLMKHGDAFGGSDPLEAIDMGVGRIWRGLEQLPSQLGGGSLASRLNDVVEQAVADYVEPADLDRLRDRLDAACTTSPRAQPGVFTPGSVPRIMEDNVSEVRSQLLRNLGDAVETWLFELDRGPSYVLSFLDGLQTRLTDRMARERADGATGSDDLLYVGDLLRDVSRDPLLGFPLFARGVVARSVLPEWEEAAKAYYVRRFRVLAARYELKIYEEIADDLKLLKSRVASLRDYIQSGLDTFSSLWEDLDKGHHVNGRILFQGGSFGNRPDPNATLEREYKYALEQSDELPGRFDRSVREAKGRVVANLRRMAGRGDDRGLWAAEGQSRFDDKRGLGKGWTRDERGRAFTSASRYFEALANRSVFDELSDDPEELAALLRRTHKLGEVFLPLQESAQGHHTPPEVAKLSVVAFKGAGKADEDRDPRIARFEEALRATVDNPRFVDYDNDSAVVFLNERGAFPVRTIKGLESMKPYYDEVFASEQAMPHSRVDVADWLPIGGGAHGGADQAALHAAEEELVKGVALGYVEAAPDRSGWYVPRRKNSNDPDLVLPFDLGQASLMLARPSNAHAISALRSRYKEARRRGLSNVVIVDKLFREFPIQLTKSNGQFRDLNGAENPWNDRIAPIAHRIRDADEALSQSYDEEFKPRPEELLDKYREQGERLDPRDRNSPEALEAGYYCPNCHAKYRTYEDLPRSCKACQDGPWW